MARSKGDGFEWINRRRSLRLRALDDRLPPDRRIVGIVKTARVRRVAWCRVGQRLDDQRRRYAVVHAEPGDPDQLTGCELYDSPSSFVAEPVIVAAGRPDVAVFGGTAARPLVDVVAVGAV